MALRTTFGDVIEMVRDECRQSSNASRGIDHLAYIKRLIKRHYELLADDFDWQHLELLEPNGDKTLGVGQRYYDYPDTLNPLKIETVWTNQTGVWTKVEYGITPVDYTLVGASEPVVKWNRYGETQFEVWPTPSGTGTLRFVGQKKPEALVTEGSRLDMDDQLVALFASAEILSGTKQPDAQAKADAAKRRLSQLRAGYADKTRVLMGRGQPEGRYPNTDAYIQGRVYQQ